MREREREKLQHNCTLFSVICILKLGLMAPHAALPTIIIISLAIYGASAFRPFGHRLPRPFHAKSRCHFTYELVQVVTYDTHYDEVRRYQKSKFLLQDMAHCLKTSLKSLIFASEASYALCYD